MKEYKLIGSASSLEKLKELIIDKMYWNICIIDINTGSVANSKGIIDGYRVIFKKNRYRLEMAI